MEYSESIGPSSSLFPNETQEPLSLSTLARQERWGLHLNLSKQVEKQKESQFEVCESVGPTAQMEGVFPS